MPVGRPSCAVKRKISSGKKIGRACARPKSNREVKTKAVLSPSSPQL
ncbi:hypothetical protein RGUI_4082 [Rhodovulum sp. P5]|nr:hypothetical protein RGUI_4082 [Rhodovulum sp. P5]